MTNTTEMPTAARNAIARLVNELKSVPDASFEIIVVQTGQPFPRRAKAKAPSARPRRAQKTIAGRCRELFDKGYSNERAWKVIQKEFHKEDRHKGIVSWYRAADRRRAAEKNEFTRASA